MFTFKQESAKDTEMCRRMMAQLHEDTVLKLKRVQTYLQGIRHKNVSIAEVLDLLLQQNVIVMRFVRDNNIDF